MEIMTTEPKNTAGELLKQSRLRQRLSIAECAKRTHIAVRYIEALEDEKWSELPSESHRLGFLRLYSRFLGVPPEEVVTMYQQTTPSAPEAADSHGNPSKSEMSELVSRTRSDWSPNSMAQLIGLAICLLILAWVIYHVVSPRLAEQNPMPWVRHHAPTQPRLLAPKPSIVVQKVRLQAQANSWLRVMSRNQLLYEGILPAGASKEWSGPGPYHFKIGDIHALSLYWNDQPVDLQTGARGAVNEIRIPPQ
jgi:transcriptional regulator with XRE-family HTH domain